jgi:hypothetical protein
VNSKIKVSDLRDPEIKQKSEHTCENGSVLKVGKAFLFRRQDFRVLRSRKEKESQLRFQVSKIENFLEGKKQGRLQHCYYRHRINALRQMICRDEMFFRKISDYFFVTEF